MKIILVGFGEVGSALHKVFSAHEEVLIHDPPQGHHVDFSEQGDLLLVAIPYSEEFVKAVKRYQKQWKIKETVIFSTVPVGISRQCDAIHSLVEAPHPGMAAYIRYANRWVGGEMGYHCQKLFKENVGFNIRRLQEPEHSEFLKLRSLAYYGLAIEFARYSGRVCDMIKMPYYFTEQYDQEYNRANAVMGRPKLTRYILSRPDGKIGGHCILQNTRLLAQQFHHLFLDAILSYNGESLEEVRCMTCGKNLPVAMGIVDCAWNVYDTKEHISGYLCDECVEKRQREEASNAIPK